MTNHNDLTISDITRLQCKMAHAHKTFFLFQLNGRIHVLKQRVTSVGYWQPSCAHQCAACVLVTKRLCSAFRQVPDYPMHSTVSPSIPLQRICV